jgi:poly(3-hydroxybutyrate) depolymerase
MPTLTDAWINVVDPVLNPIAPHVIARHYLVWDGRSNCAPGQTARLVIAMHGGHGSPADFSQKFVPQGAYVVAYPSGSNKGPFPWSPVTVSGDNLLWNTSSPFEEGQGWAGEAGVNDDLFITSLVAKLKADFGLTTVFGAGHSRGGMLAFHLACDKQLFNGGIATVATTIAEPLLSCNCTHVPDIHIHGTLDDLVGWEEPTSRPWPIAKPRITWWQNSGSGHELHVITGGEHAWDSMPGFDTTGNVWRFFDAR